MKRIQVINTFSKGIAIGKSFIPQQILLDPDDYAVADHEIPEEFKKYDRVVADTVKQLEVLAKENAIFEAHLEIARDDTLTDGVKAYIEKGYNLQAALQKCKDEWVAVFENMEDEYMRERSADIKDVCNRLMCAAKETHPNPFEEISEPVIIVARDLTPSDTARLNLDYVLGFITEEGGVTSHVSIMAKSLNIPALVGVHDILEQMESQDMIVMDAKEGMIIIGPDADVLKEYDKKKEQYERGEAKLLMQSKAPVITKDGRKVAVYANIGSVEEAADLKQFNVAGIGLLRSEFLYMENDHFPTEEEQFQAYKEIVQQVEEEAVIRTLDIGGDKQLSYFPFDAEENPFLGWRAIRFSLDMEKIFVDQLKAILRASVFGPVKIMFPMIISMSELHKAKNILEKCMQQLKKSGIPFDRSIKAGMMIETPASVMCAEEFAREVDFFSIGTNDLTQYMLAIDRGNKKMAYAYDSFHPAVLKSIKKVIDAGHAAGIPVGMCGELASDERAVPVLLGLGLDEFSVSAAYSPRVKELIRGSMYEDEKRNAKQIIK